MKSKTAIRAGVTPIDYKLPIKVKINAKYKKVLNELKRQQEADFNPLVLSDNDYTVYWKGLGGQYLYYYLESIKGKGPRPLSYRGVQIVLKI